MSKKYKIGIDIGGMILFLVIMIPTFIWSAIPAPNDILRAESSTGTIDTIASVCQVLMVATLCVFINKERKKIGITPMIIAMIICCILYFAGWMFYYNGTTNVIIILLLTVPPCLAFLFFAIDRKNKIVIVPILIFTICHLIYGIVNFII